MCTTHTNSHTRTRLTALFPGLPGWAGTREVKSIWILLKQETVSGSGISWAICKSAPRSEQITSPAPHYSVFITARCYASAVLAMALCPSVCLSVCPSVCPSVTSRCSTKTAKCRITQTTPYDSPGTLVFWCQISPRNSTGSPPAGAPNVGGVGQNRRLSTNSWLYLENGTR